MKTQKRLLAILTSVSLLLGSFGATFGMLAGALNKSGIFSYGTLSDNFDAENYNAADYWEQIGLPAYTEGGKAVLVNAYEEAKNVTVADSYENSGKGLRLASYSSVAEVEGAMRYSTYALKESFDGRKVLNMSGDLTMAKWPSDQKSGVVIVYYYEDAYNWRGFMLFGSCVRHIVSFTDGSTVYASNGTRSPQINYSNLASGTVAAAGQPIHFELAYADDGSYVTLNLNQGETKLVTNYKETAASNNAGYRSYNKDEWTTDTNIRGTSTTALKPTMALSGLNATNKIAFSCSDYDSVTATLDNLVINFEKTASDFTEQFSDLSAVTEDTAAENLARINEALSFYDELSGSAKEDAEVKALYSHIQDLLVGLEGNDYIKAYGALGNLTEQTVDEETNLKIKEAVNAYNNLSTASQSNENVKALYEKITEAYFRYNCLTSSKFTDNFTYTDVPVGTVWEQIASGADKTVSVEDGKLVLSKNSAGINNVLFWNGDKIPMVTLKNQPSGRMLEKISGDLYLNTRYANFNRGATFVYYYKDMYNWRGIALTLTGLRHLVVASTTDENGTTVYSKHDTNLPGKSIETLYKDNLTQFSSNPVNFALTYSEDGSKVNFVLKYNETEIYNVNISNDLPQNQYNITSAASPASNLVGNTDPESKIPELKDEDGNLTAKLNGAKFAFATTGSEENRFISNLTVEFSMSAQDYMNTYKSFETASAADFDSALAEAALADYAKLSEEDKAQVKELYDKINELIEYRTYAPLMNSATISVTGDRIRFKSIVFKLRDSAEITEYGTVFTYAAYMRNGKVTDSDMTADSSNQYVAVAKSANVSGLDKEGAVFYGGSFTIKPEYFGYRIVARSYVKYDDGKVYYSVNDAADSTGGTAVTDGVSKGYATRSVISIAKKIMGTLYSNKDNAGVEMSEALKSGLTEYITAMDESNITWTEKAMGSDKTGKPIIEFIIDNADDIQSALSSILAQG